MQLLAQSKGLYSSWLFHKPERILFDCGEGCAYALGNESFAIEKICIGHGHMDHIGGLLPLINIRNSGRGDKQKPLDIYYPKNDKFIELLFPYLRETQSSLRYNLNWHSIDKDQIIPLDNNKHIRTFETKHHKGLSLGYVIEEKRKSLNPAYKHLSQQEIAQGVRSGSINKNTLSQEYNQGTFAYALDAYRFNPNDVKNCEQIVMDSTFLDGSVRNNLNKDSLESKEELFTHATVEECIKLAMSSGISKRVILAHFSPRYDANEIKKEVHKVVSKYKPAFQVFPLLPGSRPIHLEQVPANKELPR